MRISLNRLSRHDDSGVALVMAMGVALIGLMVASIVITQVIVAANDSGRDRLRTSEVHAAEAAIDATMAELETSSPCAPLFSPATYGNGAQESQVTVTIAYWNDSGPVTCTSPSTLADVPNMAIITATAVSTKPVSGLAPQRTMESRVQLTPNISLGNDAAIFSVGNFETNGSFQLSADDLSETSDVWIDNGSWNCQGGVGGLRIGGSLYLPQGGLTFGSDTCRVDGDVWIQDSFGLQNMKGAEVIGGSLTIRTGDVNKQSDFSVGTKVIVGGDDNGNGVVKAGGDVSFNVGGIPNLTPVGLPTVGYTPANWPGFQERTKANFESIMTSSGFKNPNACNISYNPKQNTPLVFPKISGKDGAIYDLRSCNPLSVSKPVLSLCTDTAIFVSSFKAVSDFTINSCDSEKHNFWLIVPSPSAGGTIDALSGVNISDKIASFWYTPGDLLLNPNGKMRGQVYGGNVEIKNGNLFKYVNVGVPGVPLVKTVTNLNGFEVKLDYKTEV